jgi:hypothetical protein
MGQVVLASMLFGCFHTIKTAEDGSTRYNVYQGADAVMKTMMRPRRRHRPGCLHSDELDVVIARPSTERMDADQSAFSGQVAFSSLATCLYFKHCDGQYRNVAGEVMTLLG